MSRWRPPQPRSTAIITPQGYAMLEKELKQLWTKRRVVNDALSAAAAEGDRSENAEYIYRKKEQAGIDRRIRYLQKRMPDLKVIDQVGNKKQIFFGAIVTLEKDNGDEVRYRIVGPDETDAKRNFISIDSPLVKAILKKEVDDEVMISIGDAENLYTILSIEY
ncbi:MAG: transcription elongation factor GreB [Arenicella sp.]|nr:transcription elongation factor GreB [Arenicella sp.]